MLGSNSHLRWSALLLALLLVLGLATIAHAQGGDITRGSQVYDANCAACHGSDGQGRLGVNLSQDFPSINPSAFLRQIITNGVKGTTMPAWSRSQGGPLTDQEIDDVVAFVDSLSGGRSEMAPTATPLPVTPVPTVPGVSGDPTQGRVLFVENCAMCHGQEGQGRSGANLSDAFASINPQQFVRATVSGGVQGTAMPAWGQANGGPLTEGQIDDISAYIVGLSRAGQATPIAPSQSQPEARGTSPLVVLLVLVLVAVAIILIVQFSSRRPA